MLCALIRPRGLVLKRVLVHRRCRKVLPRRICAASAPSQAFSVWPRCSKTLTNQIIFHHFLNWGGSHIFRESWPSLPLTRFLSVLGWLPRLPESLGRKVLAQRRPKEPRRRSFWRSWNALVALLGRPISRFGACLGRCRLHANVQAYFHIVCGQIASQFLRKCVKHQRL